MHNRSAHTRIVQVMVMGSVRWFRREKIYFYYFFFFRESTYSDFTSCRFWFFFLWNRDADEYSKGGLIHRWFMYYHNKYCSILQCCVCVQGDLFNVDRSFSRVNLCVFEPTSCLFSTNADYRHTIFTIFFFFYYFLSISVFRDSIFSWDFRRVFTRGTGRQYSIVSTNIFNVFSWHICSVSAFLCIALCCPPTPR